MEVAVTITVATVLIILALIGATRWLVPKALAEEGHAEEHPDHQPPV